LICKDEEFVRYKSFRNVSSQRLLSGDASQIHLASIGDNKLSVYVQQNKIRLDRKYDEGF
jgi:hypothetical protein